MEKKKIEVWCVNLIPLNENFGIEEGIFLLADWVGG